MRKRYNIKSKLAGMLAAAMVFSMAAPGIPAYAVNYGETSVIEFDPQAGPVRESSFPVIAAWHPAGLWREICLWQMDRLGVL